MSVLRLRTYTGTVLLKFRIKVQGYEPYEGLFISSAAAQADAEQRFPDSPPASVLCLSRIQQRGAH